MGISPPILPDALQGNEVQEGAERNLARNLSIRPDDLQLKEGSGEIWRENSSWEFFSQCSARAREIGGSLCTDWSGCPKRERSRLRERVREKNSIKKNTFFSISFFNYFVLNYTFLLTIYSHFNHHFHQLKLLSF